MDNPFFYNYVWSSKDLNRIPTNRWLHIELWFRVKKAQISVDSDHLFKFFVVGARYYYVGYEEWDRSIDYGKSPPT